MTSCQTLLIQNQALTHRWVDAGPASKTVDQHQPNGLSTYLLCTDRATRTLRVATSKKVNEADENEIRKSETTTQTNYSKATDSGQRACTLPATYGLLWWSICLIYQKVLTKLACMIILIVVTETQLVR